MILIRSLLLLTFSSIVSTSFAQREASTWAFGYQGGLDFINGNPEPTESAIRTLNGSAVVSDRVTGNLLFYTDGRNFWNGSHEVMQNAHTLPYNCVSLITQPAIIIPSVHSDFLFHVFCIRAQFELPPFSNPDSCLFVVDKSKVPENESGLGLYYYLVDMRLDDGMGNIVESESNILLQTNIAQKLTAIPHANGMDYWILVHGWGDNSFYAYRCAEGQVITVVRTDIGSVHGNYEGIYFEDELQGELKASPDGAKIASAVFSDYRPFDLFDFNTSTGMLSNYTNLGNVKGQYGVSFSPDNSRLYLGSDGRYGDSDLKSIILQFDLHAGDASAIAASGKSIIINNPKTNIPNNGIFEGWDTPEKGMSLAPDGRLYVSGNTFNDGDAQDHILVVIENPNGLGFNCNVNYKTFGFNGSQRTGIGLPNFMQSYFNGLESTMECEEEPKISVYPNPTNDILRIENDPACHSSYSLTVYNKLAQIILFKPIIPDQYELDLRNMADGIYILKFISRSNEITKRVVKSSGS